MNWQAIKSVLQAPLYQPIEHPDFDGVAVCQPCVERWEMIKPLLPKTGTAVDLGCHTGWFCRRFVEMGWQSHGYDRSPEWLAVAEYLSHGQENRPEYHLGDLATAFIPKCDAMLCLSVAMYLFDDVERGWQTMRLLSGRTRLMVMDFGGMYANKLPFTESNAIEKIVDRTWFTTGRLVGHTGFESRPLFVFEA